jgi:3'(2'), 5'-bisphosphate nucleotidase
LALIADFSGATRVQHEAFAELVEAVRAAGDAVLEVYSEAFDVEAKADGSPVTEADRRSEEIILDALRRLAPDVPVIAEESAGDLSERPAPALFWLVDPLDGTKEFISRNGEFTVNVALIEDGVPILGLVLAPARGRLFMAAPGMRPIVEDAGGRREIAARSIPRKGATVVSSRSHGDPEALAKFTAGRAIAAHVSAGSSLKFCVVAVGEADIYPRFGRTMEWDTAAGHAVLLAAGGRVEDLSGRPLRYGKPGFENPHFVAYGLGDS